jgi:MFS family permease
VGCALAGSVHQLIAARAVQGIGGALLVPGSLALISASFPEKERGKAIGTWSGFSGITAAVGPVLGGFLVDHFSWVWAFLINVPMALGVLWIVWRHVPESRGASARGGLDLWGALLATAGLGGIVYAFIEAPTQGWHRRRCWRRWPSAWRAAWASSRSSARCDRRCCRSGCCASATSAAPTC